MRYPICMTRRASTGIERAHRRDRMLAAQLFRRRLICCLLLAAGALGGCTGFSQKPTSGAEERPNILFILTDDQGPWALGMQAHRHPQLLGTPHMDRIGRSGAHLVNAFVTTPVCSPSRAGLMTSRYGTELGITDWIHPEREPDLGLDPHTVTWPEMLQAAGYVTGLVGKWHLGTAERFHPTRAGFDDFMGFREGGTQPVNPVLEHDGKRRPYEGFTTDILTDHAIAFIRRHQGRSFMLSVHYRAPHAPWLPLPEADWAPYRDIDPQIVDPGYPALDVERVKRVTREYLASVAGIDRNVGRLLDVLDELNLARNTIVVFTSDHGYNLGHQGLLYKGNAQWMLTELPPGTENVPAGQRPNLFDRSLRVPALVCWPGTIRPGTVVTETVSNLDWYPTLLAAAGVALPEGVPVRGRNVLPLLKGEQVEHWNDDLYAEYSMHHGARTHMRMYRTPQWKLVRDFLNPERDELYHLESDPHEVNNLISDPRPEVQRVIRRLHARMLERMQEVQDPLLY